MNTDNATPSLPDYEDKALSPHKVRLVEAELDKANIRQEFGWYVVISPDGSEIKVSKLVHVPSDSYFIFNCDELDSMSQDKSAHDQIRFTNHKLGLEIRIKQ
jgi:hypothetical protein